MSFWLAWNRLFLLLIFNCLPSHFYEGIFPFSYISETPVSLQGTLPISYICVPPLPTSLLPFVSKVVGSCTSSTIHKTLNRIVVTFYELLKFQHLPYVFTFLRPFKSSLNYSLKHKYWLERLMSPYLFTVIPMFFSLSSSSHFLTLHKKMRNS